MTRNNDRANTNQMLRTTNKHMKSNNKKKPQNKNNNKMASSSSSSSSVNHYKKKSKSNNFKTLEAPYLTTELEWDSTNPAINLRTGGGGDIDAVTKDIGDLIQDNFWTVVGAVLFLLFLYMARPQIPDERHRNRGRGGRGEPKDEDEGEDPEVRQQRIAAALTTKVVVGQDKEGNLTLADRDEALRLAGSQSDAASSSATEQLLNILDDNEASDCVICLEPFGLWDEVGWSNNNNNDSSSRGGCKHVWHAECIRSWLRDHDDCPNCRAAILQDDEEQQDDEDLESPPARVAEDAPEAAAVGLLAGGVSSTSLQDKDNDNNTITTVASTSEASSCEGEIELSNLVILKGQSSIGVAKRDP